MSRHLRLIKVTLKPGNRSLAEQIANHAPARMSQLPGFVPGSGVFYLDGEGETTIGGITIWESREAAEQAGEPLESGTIQALGDALDGELESSIHEVYEPK